MGFKNILEYKQIEDTLGIAFSYFNLMITTKKLSKTFSVECAFQSSKVFEGNVQYLDLFSKTSQKKIKIEKLGNVIELIFIINFGKQHR